MPGATVTMNFEEVDELKKYMEEFADSGALTIINDVLQNDSESIIENNIQLLVPMSGRTWKGKKTAARSTMPWEKSKNQDMLSITISSKKAYQYLYFPDDGSTTRRHAGQQDFTGKGAENSREKIINMCLENLTKAFEK